MPMNEYPKSYKKPAQVNNLLHTVLCQWQAREEGNGRQRSLPHSKFFVKSGQPSNFITRLFLTAEADPDRLLLTYL